MNKVIDNIERRIRRNIDFRKEDLKEYVLLCVAYFIAVTSNVKRATMPVVKDNVYQTVFSDNVHIIIDVHSGNK